MNNPKKFPVGALLYWVSLACCALVMVTDGFSFAGNGYYVNENKPCLVTNADCPKCATLDAIVNAYYNMAGVTIFRTRKKAGGDFHNNGSESIPCYKYAMCKDTSWNVNRKCDLEIGCVDEASTKGCKDLVQQSWFTMYMNRERWVEITEK